MGIKSSTFGRTELSGKDAVRFLQHMEEDKPNEWLLSNLKNAQRILADVNARRNKLKKLIS
jgi:hypothetical protein